MTRPATLLLLGAIAGAFLATVLGAWLVFWRSPAEATTAWVEPYDGEAVGV